MESFINTLTNKEAWICLDKLFVASGGLKQTTIT